jgi:DNA-directed RNA polymerase subunit M/transcription elongation factor TFIIS
MASEDIDDMPEAPVVKKTTRPNSRSSRESRVSVNNIEPICDNPTEFMRLHILKVCLNYRPFARLSQDLQNTITRRLERSCRSKVSAECETEFINRNFSDKTFVERYSACCYKLMANLDVNSCIHSDAFLSNIMTGVIDPKHVASLTSKEMCPEASEHERKELDIRMDQKIDVKFSDKYQCNICKAKKTRYFKFQKDASDEAASICFECISCGHRWVR